MIENNKMIFNSYRRALQARGRSEQTIESYYQAIEELDHYTSGIDVTEMTKADLETFFAQRLAEVSSVTVAIRFRSIRAFFNWCESEGEVELNPMKGLKEPKTAPTPPDVVSDDDLRKLIKVCNGPGIWPKRDEAIIRLFCEPGSPRLGEMAEIRVVDLDMKRDVIKVTGKTGTREIPFGAKTGMALDRYLRARRRHPNTDLTYLWVAQKGWLTPSGIAQMLARRASEAGLERIHPHQLRHTSASRWFESGGSTLDAMALFGWTTDAMAQVYGRSAAISRAHKAAKRASLGDRI